LTDLNVCIHVIDNGFLKLSVNLSLVMYCVDLFCITWRQLP